MRRPVGLMIDYILRRETQFTLRELVPNEVEYIRTVSAYRAPIVARSLSSIRSALPFNSWDWVSQVCSKRRL